jgi:hypothetical protein
MERDLDTKSVDKREQVQVGRKGNADVEKEEEKGDFDEANCGQRSKSARFRVGRDRLQRTGQRAALAVSLR